MTDANHMDMATAYKTVTDILMRNFMPPEFSGDKADNPHVVLMRRGVSTVTDEIFAIMEQLYNPEEE